jgi:UDP-N-acetylglucosamine diphosphorylase/glucosamine-1-phosphate N-acetyltransferase
MPCPATINTPLDDEPVILINGRVTGTAGIAPLPHPAVAVEPSGSILFATGQFPGLMSGDALSSTDRWQALLALPKIQPLASVARRLWDILANSSATITDAARQLAHSPVPPGPFHLINPEKIFIGQHVTLAPGCVLDASAGPIILADHAAIGANAVLTGPCYVGPGSTVATLSQIRGGVSIGPRCKVGGELSNSILIGNSNKAHDGFLGDSYLGEWVNLGAGTVTSNLKNTYGEVIMPAKTGPVATGRQFIGSMIGDHAKTAVATRLMTGSYIGYGAMIATTAPPPRVVPSFTFLTDHGPEPYHPEKAAAVMAAVFARRGRTWTDDDASMNESVRQTAVEVEP